MNKIALSPVQLRLLQQLVDLALRLSELYDQAEQQPCIMLDYKITRTLSRLENSYEKAVQVGISLYTDYVVQSAQGHLYVLSLTQLGLEYQRVN